MTEDLPDLTSQLLKQAGFLGSFSIEPCKGGGNNRVFRVATAQGDFLLKSYFHHPEDVRNRLLHEFSFCSFANRYGISCVPKALAQDREHHLGLYEFVQGRHFKPVDLSDATITAALEFFKAINHFRNTDEARDLPIASEAYFSIENHLRTIRRRIEKLSQITLISEIHQQAFRFVHSELIPKWEDLERKTRSRALQLKISVEEELSPSERCLSPSDFGFHNALLRDTGELCFLDFEYAGWDEVAKMICDFFCQVALPISPKYRKEFTESAVAFLPNPEMSLKRIRLLFPAFQIKWCCIILNNFLAVGNRRRLFADETPDVEERKILQLKKAERNFANLLEEMEFIP